uniref:IP16118p n=1 Tax=Drosophila melanogaster TaxID=7227 RepID=Q058T8_DROME|nr:IP16118p [Drosophila melanogaster]
MPATARPGTIHSRSTRARSAGTRTAEVEDFRDSTIRTIARTSSSATSSSSTASEDQAAPSSSSSEPCNDICPPAVASVGDNRRRSSSSKPNWMRIGEGQEKEMTPMRLRRVHLLLDFNFA